MDIVTDSQGGENMEQKAEAKKSFMSDERAVGNIVDKIVGVVVGFLLIGYVGPSALVALANATGMTGTVNTLFTTVLPILGVIVFLIIVVNYVKK